MVSLFKDKSITAVFFLLLLCGITHVHLIIHSTNPPHVSDTGLLSFLLNTYIYTLPTTLLTVIYFLLIAIQAIRLNMVLNEWKMFTQEGFTTAMSYVLLTGFFAEWGFLSPALIANSFVIWIFECLCRLYNHNNPKTLLFNIGLIIGAGVVCYQPLVVLVLVAFFALMVIRAFVISEWLVLFLGIVMPFYLIASILFLNDQTHLLVSFLPNLQFKLPISHVDIWLYSKLGVLLLLLLFGFSYWSQYNARMVIQIRKNWSVLMVMLVLIFPVCFFTFDKGFTSCLLAIVPFAAFSSNAFLYPKNNWLPNLLLLACMVLIVYNNYTLLQQ